MRLTAIVLTFGLVPALGLTACGPSEPQADEALGPSIELAEDVPLVGGWTAAPVDSVEIIQAARFAASQGASVELTEIIAAESQVVAGINHRLVIELEDGSLWQSEVFISLEGDMELVSFDPA